MLSAASHLMRAQSCSDPMVMQLIEGRIQVELSREAIGPRLRQGILEDGGVMLREAEH